MMKTEKFICGDCKGITEITTGKRGSFFIELLLWNLIIPGIFYSIWRRKSVKRICQYCGSDFLLPADSMHTKELLQAESGVVSRKF